MSLILLFLPHGATPSSGNESPAVIHSIETLRPTIYAIDTTKPVTYSIETFKPTIALVEQTLGVFQESTITYDSATVTYDSATELYGGSDRIQPVGAILYSIDNFKPVVYRIEKA